MRSSSIIYWASAALFFGCSNAGDVLTTQNPADDAGIIFPDAAAGDALANNDDAAVPADSGADAGSEDVITPPPPPFPWERVPGHYGAAFRHGGGGDDYSYLIGRRFDESMPRLYRLDENENFQRMNHPVDGDGSPQFPPIGSITEQGSRILWATESQGILASENSGATWLPLNIPWEDGSVGNGNGHVSRILDSWSAGNAFCVHREVTPWEEFRVLDDLLYNEIRCLENDTWTTITSSIAEGVRFFNAYGQDLYGATSPQYNWETSDPKFCHSANLGVTWDCFPFSRDSQKFYRLASGRLVMPNWIQPGPALETEFYYSDDHGQTWEYGLTIPQGITEFAAVGETLYGVTYMLDVVNELFEIDLDAKTFQAHARPTEAHTYWLDIFEHGGELFIADTRNVRRFDAANARWVELAIEPLPALRVTADPSGKYWTIDGTRTARSFEDNAWVEHFFDDTGWGQGDIVDHAVSYDFTTIGAKIFFGAAHRKIFQVDTSLTPVVVTEDQNLVAVVDPDSVLINMANAEGYLFAAGTGGEHVNHGNGNRTPYGGGAYRRDPQGNWSDIGTGLPPRSVGNSLGYGIVSALYANTGILIAATQDGVYRSVNMGAAWSEVDGIAAYDATAIPTLIAGDGNKVLLAKSQGTTNVFYFSSDNQNFSLMTGDLPAGTLRDLAEEGGTFYALLDPLGVFQSVDNGHSWHSMSHPSGPRLPERTFSLMVDEGLILLGTADGVWRMPR